LKSDSLSQLCQPLLPELRAEHVCFTSHVTYFCFPHLNAISRRSSASRCHWYQPTVTKSLSKKMYI